MSSGLARQKARLVARWAAETPIDEEDGGFWRVSPYRGRSPLIRFLKAARFPTIRLESPGPLS